MAGGYFRGFPVITSEHLTSVGSPSTQTIIAVKASDVYLADDGVVTVEASDQASIEMVDTSSQSAHERHRRLARLAVADRRSSACWPTGRSPGSSVARRRSSTSRRPPTSRRNRSVCEPEEPHMAPPARVSSEAACNIRVLKELPQGQQPGAVIDLHEDVGHVLELVAAVESVQTDEPEAERPRRRYVRRDLTAAEG
jgi:hypothetical protein